MYTYYIYTLYIHMTCQYVIVGCFPIAQVGFLDLALRIYCVRPSDQPPAAVNNVRRRGGRHPNPVSKGASLFGDEIEKGKRSEVRQTFISN